MQDIATKLSRIATAVKAAGLTEQQARHLIHGTGGSPRRARKAIRLGIHEQLIAAYDAALSEQGSHAKAVIACNKLYAELVPTAAAEPGDDESEVSAAVTPAYPAARRSRKPVAQQIAELGECTAAAENASHAASVAAGDDIATTRRKVAKAAAKVIAKAAAAKPGTADLKALLPA